jgi:hypothetical protein
LILKAYSRCKLHKNQQARIMDWLCRQISSARDESLNIFRQLV